jgi:hypothetical protein
MEKQINFEDNIFIINVRIRLIQDLQILDADPAMFLDKTMDDVEFIDSALAALLRELKGNSRLIERAEQFYNLSEAERLFASLLDDLYKGESNFSASLTPEMKGKVQLLKGRSQERKASIGTVVVSGEKAVPEPLVSPDELHELLNTAG